MLNNTYSHLFEDIGRLVGFGEIRGSAYEGLDWALNIAPTLDKKLIEALVMGEQVAPPDQLPRSLFRLWIAATTPDQTRDGSVQACYIRSLRQLLTFGYKAGLPYTNDQEQKAYQNWQISNDSCLNWGPSLGNPPATLDTARKYAQCRLRHWDREAVEPSHGPGAVYIRGSKHAWTSWFQTIESKFPYSEWFHTSTGFSEDDMYPADIVEQIPCRSSAVPKDARGPRLVFVHPAEAVWIQQGVRRMLEKTINRTQCHGRISFDDQTTNQELALSSSGSGLYATIDLKDASDRIPDSLVQAMIGLRRYPLLGCCRASVAHIEDRKIPIHMYAPMGNATTFPVESLIFWAISCAAMEHEGLRPECYVVGDDLIVPTSAYHVVTDALSQYNLVVNTAKSFAKGFFRESCGVDAYRGNDVTPLRWKQGLGIAGPECALALSDLAMRLRQRTYEEAARYLYGQLSRFVRKHCKTRLGITNDPKHGAICEWTDVDREVWYPAFWEAKTQQFVSPVHALIVRQERVAHGWNHVLSDLCSLQRTHKGCSPARVATRHSRLTRSWRPIL